jgi:pimeloyl-ACP methyl ester carboxylesterase
MVADMSFATVQLITRLKGDTLYVVFRATDTVDDIRVHFFEHKGMQIPFYNPDPRARVHGGWAVDYKGIRHRLISYISRLYEQNGFKSICFVGHSYGGALAAQGALDVPFILGIDPMNVSLVTFGAPRMGNGAFVRALKECVPNQVHYIYGADVIPSLPLWIMGYRQYKSTVRLGKRTLGSVVKNSLTVGLSMIRAKIKKEPFDYFQFMVASDHVLGVFDGEMEVEV